MSRTLKNFSLKNTFFVRIRHYSYEKLFFVRIIIFRTSKTFSYVQEEDIKYIQFNFYKLLVKKINKIEAYKHE